MKRCKRLKWGKTSEAVTASLKKNLHLKINDFRKKLRVKIGDSSGAYNPAEDDRTFASLIVLLLYSGAP